MGIFDDLGKYMTNAGQRAVQMTEAMSETARIYSLISQNESKINELYYDIGKLYIDIHKNDPEDAFVQMFAEVAELEQQNENYRYQIQRAKGIQRCAKCGAEVSAEAAYCSFCGYAIPKPEIKQIPADYIKCSSCGALVKRGMRFCTSCGHPMALPEDQESMPEIKAEKTEKICPRCGARLMDDSVFCTECGIKL